MDSWKRWAARSVTWHDATFSAVAQLMPAAVSNKA